MAYGSQSGGATAFDARIAWGGGCRIDLGGRGAADRRPPSWFASACGSKVAVLRHRTALDAFDDAQSKGRRPASTINRLQKGSILTIFVSPARHSWRPIGRWGGRLNGQLGAQ